MGQQALGNANYGEAENQFRLAVADLDSTNKWDPKLPQVLNNLANVLRQTGKHAEAETTYKRAIEIKEKVAGPFSQELVPILQNYAKLLKMMGKEQEATKIEKKAMALFSKT